MGPEAVAEDQPGPLLLNILKRLQTLTRRTPKLIQVLEIPPPPPRTDQLKLGVIVPHECEQRCFKLA